MKISSGSSLFTNVPILWFLVFKGLKYLLSLTGYVLTSSPVVSTITMFTSIRVEVFEADWIGDTPSSTPQQFTLSCMGLTLAFVTVGLK